ncbi:MAG: multiprotein-bridging factor 1 family protein [Paracoccaceae bacterium]
MTDTTENWYDADVATFGDRLAAAREAAGMTPEIFAKRLGVKLTTLSRWEEDLAEPRANRLSMMSGLLGVSMPWLITGVGAGVETSDIDEQNADTRALLSELRQIRADMMAKAEHVGRIEKRLRKMLQEPSNV